MATNLARRPLTDAEMQTMQAPQRRPLTDAEMQTHQTASPALQATMASLFTPEPAPRPQPMPAYDPSTGAVLAPGPRVETAQIGADIAAQGAGPRMTALPTAPIPQPTLPERMGAEFTQQHENTLAGLFTGGVQAGERFARQAEQLDNIIAYSERQGSDVALPLGSDYAPATRTKLPLVPGVEQSYVESGQVPVDPLTGMATPATFDPNTEAQQVLGGPFAGKPLAELKAMRDVAQQNYDAAQTPFHQTQKRTAAGYELMPSAKGVVENVAAFAGGAAGALATPETFAGIPGGGAATTLTRTVVREAVANGLINMLLDPVIQQGQVKLGTRKEYDPLGTLAAGATGVGFGAAFPIGGALTRRFFGVARNWLSRRRGVSPADADPATITPDEQAEFAHSPDVQAFIDAHGGQLTPEQITTLTGRVETRRAAEADQTVKMQQAQGAPERAATSEQGPLQGGVVVKRGKGPAGRQAQQLATEIDAARQTNEPQIRGNVEGIRSQIEARVDNAIAKGQRAGTVPRDISPEARQAAIDQEFEAEVQRRLQGMRPPGREPLPDVITPATATTPSTATGVELRGKFHAPAVIEPQPTRLTPEEIAHQQRVGTAGRGSGRFEWQGKGKKRRRVWVPTETPERLLGGERQPMTPTDIEGQRQAGGAFTLAERQRARAEGLPGAVDVRAAGRPQGAGQVPVTLHQGFPVQVLRQRHERINGRDFTIATVRRYDPRTGQPEADAIEYDVRANQLTTARYAPEAPRLAQEVEQARRGPRPPEQPRGPTERISREQKQTYRMTPQDVGREFPGAAAGGRPGEPGPGPMEGRPPFPEQPAGPHPGRPYSTAEEALREFMRHAQEQARERAQRQQERARYRPREEARAREQQQRGRSTNKEQALDAEGRFPVDNEGYVLSTGGGPIIFPTPQQAARWLLGVGQKQSRDQLFDVAVHPVADGAYSIKERGRYEAPPEEPPPGEPPPQEPPPEPPPQPEPQGPPQETQPTALSRPAVEEPAAQRPTSDTVQPEPTAPATPPVEPAPVPEQAAPAEEPTPEPPPKPKRERKAKPAPEAPPAPETIPEDHRRWTVTRHTEEAGGYYGHRKLKQENVGEVTARSQADAERAAREKFGQEGRLEVELKKGEAPPVPPPEIKTAAGAGFHAVNDIDTAGPTEVINKRTTSDYGRRTSTNLVRAGEYHGTSAFILRRGVDPEFDARLTTEVGKGKKETREVDPEHVRGLLAEAKQEVSPFEPLVAYDPSLRQEYHRTSAGGIMPTEFSGDPVVVGKLGGETVAIDARFYDYVAHHLGLELRGKMHGGEKGVEARPLFGIYDGDKVVGVTLGERAMPADVKANAPGMAEQIGPPMPLSEARAYRAQKRPGASYGGERGGAKPYRPTPGVKKAATELQREFTGRLAEHRTAAAAGKEARIAAEAAHSKAHQAWSQELYAAGREAATTHAAADKLTFQNSFGRGATGEGKYPRMTPEMETGYDLGSAWAKTHRMPKLPKEGEIGVIRETLRTARGKETKFEIKNAEDVLAALQKRTSGPSALPMFYSNPMFDPALWRMVARDLGKLGHHVAAGLHTLRKGISPHVDQARIYLSSIRGFMKAIDARNNSPALRSLMDSVATDPGTERHVAQTYQEGVEQRATRGANAVSDAIEHAFDYPSSASDRKIIRDVLSGVHRGAVPQRVREATSRIRRWLDNVHAEMKAAGIDLGYVPGRYFPRMFDPVKIERDLAGFTDKLTKVYRSMGVDDPENAADALVNELTYGNVSDLRSHGNGQPWMKGRKFPADVERMLDGFYIDDPLEALHHYSYSTARKIEYAKRFGANNEKMHALFEQMRKEGVSDADRLQMRRLFDTATGRDYISAQGAGGSLASMAQTSGMIALLPRAWMSSLLEPFNATVRTGQLSAGLRLIGEQLAGMVPTQRAKELKSLTRALGIITDSAMDQVMHNRFGDSAVRRRGRRVLTKFFRRSGLTGLTNSQRRAAVSMGRAWIDTLAGAAKEGDANAIRELAELGVAEKDIGALHKFTDAKDGRITAQDIANGGSAATLYSQAMKRFVDQVIQNPKIVDRPLAAGRSVVGSLLYSLTSFNWAFQRNVMQFAGRRVGSALMRREFGRAMRYGTAFGVASGAMGGWQALRQYLSDPEAWSQQDDQTKVMRIASQVGLFGGLDQLANVAFNGLKYDASTKSLLAGTYPGFFAEQIDKVLALGGRENSPHTSTKEKQAARAVYQGLALPLVNWGLSELPGGGATTLATTALMSLLADPNVKRAAGAALAEPLFGAPTPKLPRGKPGVLPKAGAGVLPKAGKGVLPSAGKGVLP